MFEANKYWLLLAYTLISTSDQFLPGLATVVQFHYRSVSTDQLLLARTLICTDIVICF